MEKKGTLFSEACTIVTCEIIRSEVCNAVLRNDPKKSINMLSNLQSFCLDTIISLQNIIPTILSRFNTTVGINSLLYISIIHLILERKF